MGWACGRQKKITPQPPPPNKIYIHFLIPWTYGHHIMLQKILIKLRILRGKAYTGLSRWALCAILCFFLREAGEDEIKTYTEKKALWRWTQRLE